MALNRPHTAALTPLLNALHETSFTLNCLGHPRFQVTQDTICLGLGNPAITDSRADTFAQSAGHCRYKSVDIATIRRDQIGQCIPVAQFSQNVGRFHSGLLNRQINHGLPDPYRRDLVLSANCARTYRQQHTTQQCDSYDFLHFISPEAYDLILLSWRQSVIKV